jgi:RNA polymerase sigma factor (sigma-70 family)
LEGVEVVTDELEAAYAEHFAPLMRVAFLLTGSNAAAEDAVHEVFLRCAPRLATLDHPASYLRTAVVNECRTQHRRWLRARDEVGPTDPAGLPDELVELQEALARLSHRQRAVVVLRAVVDLPDDEIARILDCRASTVRSLHHRAVARLREELA